MENKTPQIARTGIASDAAPPWHTLHLPEVGDKLASNLDSGLSPEECKRRIAHFGANELIEKPPG